MLKEFDDCSDYDCSAENKILNRLRSVPKDNFKITKAVQAVNDFNNKFLTNDDYLDRFKRIYNGKGYKFEEFFDSTTNELIIEYFENYGLKVFSRRIFDGYYRYYIFEPSEYNSLNLLQKLFLMIF